MYRNHKSSLVGIAMVMAMGVAQVGVLPTFAQTNATPEAVNPCVLYGAEAETAETVESEIAEQEEQTSNAEEAAESDETHEADDSAETDVGDESENHTDDVQEPAYTGSIALDETTLDGLTEDEECATLISLSTVTADEARIAAETESGSVAVKVEIDDENGYLVYSVEMQDGSEVKVDAGSAAILYIEPIDTGEGE